MGLVRMDGWDGEFRMTSRRVVGGSGWPLLLGLPAGWGGPGVGGPLGQSDVEPSVRWVGAHSGDHADHAAGHQPTNRFPGTRPLNRTQGVHAALRLVHGPSAVAVSEPPASGLSPSVGLSGARTRTRGCA